MPGIDFNRVRREVTMEEVLNLVGFAATRRSGMQWYGRCPLEGCVATRRGSFSVNVAVGRYFCHRCGSRGNALELWAALTNAPLHQAAIDLCERLGRDVPWIRRW